MDKFINDLFDRASDFFNKRPGLLPLIGILLILLNFILQWAIYGWASSNPLLHLGLIIGLIGLLLVRPFE